MGGYLILEGFCHTPDQQNQKKYLNWSTILLTLTMQNATLKNNQQQKIPNVPRTSTKVVTVRTSNRNDDRRISYNMTSLFNRDDPFLKNWKPLSHYITNYGRSILTAN